MRYLYFGSVEGDLQEGHFTLPNANSPSARAQNRGFCVRKGNFSQVLPPLEHKIGELGFLYSGRVIEERAKGSRNLRDAYGAQYSKKIIFLLFIPLI